MKNDYVNLVKKVLRESNEDFIDTEEGLETEDEFLTQEEEPMSSEEASVEDQTEEEPQEDEVIVLSFNEVLNYFVLKKLERDGDLSLNDELNKQLSNTQTKIEKLGENKLNDDFQEIFNDCHQRAFEKFKTEGFPVEKNVFDYCTGGVKAQGKEIKKVDEVVETVKEVEVPVKDPEVQYTEEEGELEI
jgi:hypothetical protein